MAIAVSPVVGRRREDVVHVVLDRPGDVVTAIVVSEEGVGRKILRLKVLLRTIRRREAEHDAPHVTSSNISADIRFGEIKG